MQSLASLRMLLLLTFSNVPCYEVHKEFSNTWVPTLLKTLTAKANHAHQGNL